MRLTSAVSHLRWILTALFLGTWAAGFIVPRLAYTPNVRSQQQIAKIQIMEFKGALEMFCSDTGRYPTEKCLHHILRCR